MIKKFQKMLETDIAAASNIGKWLIIIALSGIAIYFLFMLIVGVAVFIYVAPKMKTVAERLRAHPAMKNGTPKQKCVAVAKESISVLFPDELKNVQFMKDAHDSMMKYCDKAADSSSAAEFYDKVMNKNGSDSVHDTSSPAYNAHQQSNVAAAAAAEKNLSTHQVPKPHDDAVAAHEEATGLGQHTA